MALMDDVDINVKTGDGTVVNTWTTWLPFFIGSPEVGFW
jgi:hypothetical protein